MFFQQTWHEEMTKGLFDDGSSSDEGIGSDGEGIEVKAPVLADRRKTKKTKRKEAERKAEVKTDVSSHVRCSQHFSNTSFCVSSGVNSSHKMLPECQKC